MEIVIIKMLPAEQENGGLNLHIHYTYSKNIFGNMLLAATEKGICYAAFDDDRNTAFLELKNIFPKAVFLNQSNYFIENAIPRKKKTHLSGDCFVVPPRNDGTIFLHIKGTDFQITVWEELLKIPFGETSTYGEIARKIHKPKASRAVGSAVGANPVSFFVPCHRVLQSTGKIGGYHWGVQRKKNILDWEKNYGK